MTFAEQFEFIPDPNAPLYQQLYAQIRAAILAGRLKGGLKLPSTRTLADELGISRNTVLNAYEQLFAEGYIESVEGSGTFVARVLPEDLMRPPAQNRAKRRTATNPPNLSHSSTAISAIPPLLVSQVQRSGRVAAFMAGTPALDAFPFDLWSKIIAHRARHMQGSEFAYRDPIGFPPLREAIAAHVTVARQVRCTPEQVIITAGSQGALDLAARVILNPGDTAWIENPGYLGATGALTGAGVRLIPVPVDAEGLQVETGIAHAPDARLVYVTPSHQFPLGVTMSLSRRLALLEWAKRAGAYILEDDYDSEYRFAGRPLAALQALDESGRVLYIGTFSKVMFPALRLGYLIAPPDMIDALLALRRYIDFHPPTFEQVIMTDFMTQGHFTRHIRRMRTLYAERRGILLEAARDLPLELDAPDTGMHLVGWLPAGVDDAAASQSAQAHEVNAQPVSKFCLTPIERKGLLLGYSAVDEREILSGVRRLAMALMHHL